MHSQGRARQMAPPQMRRELLQLRRKSLPTFPHLWLVREFCMQASIERLKLIICTTPRFAQRGNLQDPLHRHRLHASRRLGPYYYGLWLPPGSELVLK